MTKIVKITTEKPVRFSVDGRNVQEFDPGNLYEVPDHVADGMVRRNWGEIMNAEDIKALEGDDASGGTPAPEPAPQPAPEPAPEVTEPEGGESSGGTPEGEAETSEDGDDEGDDDSEDDRSQPQGSEVNTVAPKRGPGRPRKSS